jgi:hypothetical protein
MGSACSTNAERRRRMHIGYWRESQKERDHWEDHGTGGWAILKGMLERQDGMAWIELMWLTIGTSGGLF